MMMPQKTLKILYNGFPINMIDKWKATASDLREKKQTPRYKLSVSF